MEVPLHKIANFIGSFVEVVVPAIQVGQQQKTTSLVSLSGLATFVSAVTGVLALRRGCRFMLIIQYSYRDSDYL